MSSNKYIFKALQELILDVFKAAMLLLCTKKKQKGKGFNKEIYSQLQDESYFLFPLLQGLPD